MITSPGSQQTTKEIPKKDDQKVEVHSTQSMQPETSTQREDYPDLFLSIRENYRISDHFHGYSESLSADNNPMVLVELNNLSYRYGTSFYAVDRVNGTMYGKFNIGYRMIPEKATVIPQYQHTSVEDEYAPAYANTLLGITSVPTPIAKSTPIPYASHIPTSKLGTEGDIVQPISSEEARAAYLEECMKNMGGVQLPFNIPAKVEESHTSVDLARRIDIFCKEQKERRRQEWESHKQVLNALKERKSQQFKQLNKEEGEVIYSQIAQDVEKTRDVVRRSMSRASTISAEERQMALTEKEFYMIKRKMDKIDHRLHEMYKSWHAEYGNANTLEECEEIKNFYKPYLEKYESKYRVLYHLLQQPRLIPMHDGASGITSSLAALDDAASSKQREWIRSEPGEDTPWQYTSIKGCLTPHTSRSDDMRLEPTLNVTPEGSLTDIPTVVRREAGEQALERETLGTSSEMAYMDFPNTQGKTISKDSDRPTTLCGTKEASKAEVLASMRQFFAAVDQRNTNIPVGDQRTSVEVHVRDDIEVLEVLTTTVVTTTIPTPTSPNIADTDPRGTGSPWISLPERTVPHPTVTATCRPRTLMQQLTEGQTAEPRREGDSSNESLETIEETIPGEIPDELGHEWRDLHPFDLPGMRFHTDTTPSNQRRLAENDALVELIQMTEYLDDVPTRGHRDY